MVAGLLALSFTPVLWARALRLTRQRLQVQIPVSMQEVLADRDQLRAGFAIAARALEQEMETVRASKAADMSELGRRAIDIFALSQQITSARQELELQRRELERLTRQTGEAEAGLAATQIALGQNHVYFEQRLETHEALKKSFWQLEEVLEQKRGTIGALQTRVSGLEMTIEDAARARAALTHQLEAARQQAVLAGEERDLLANQLGAARAAQETLRKRLTAETALVADLGEAKRALQGELDAARVKIRLGEAELEGAGRAAQEAKDRERAASLRHSLEAAQRRVSATTEDQVAVSDAILRASIHGLGLAIAEMAPPAATAPAEQENGSKRVSEKSGPSAF